MTLTASSYIPQKTMDILQALKLKKVPVEWEWDSSLGKVKLKVPRGTMKGLGRRKQDLQYLEVEITNLIKRNKITALDLQLVASMFGSECREAIGSGLERVKVK